jgi:hypothetical protein
MRGALLFGTVALLITGAFGVGTGSATGELYCLEEDHACCDLNEAGLHRIECNLCVTHEDGYYKKWEYYPGHACWISIN